MLKECSGFFPGHSFYKITSTGIGNIISIFDAANGYKSGIHRAEPNATELSVFLPGMISIFNARAHLSKTFAF